MALQLHFHGTVRDGVKAAHVKGWAAGTSAGVSAEEGDFAAHIYPSRGQAAQIVRALAKFAGLIVVELLPAEGWDDPSAGVMNAEADADAEEHLDRTRPE